MNDIVALVNANPVSVLIDEKTYSEFYAKMKAELDGFQPDTSTDKGRKEIASMAYKVTRTKTAIDAAGKKLNEDARAQINVVDANRRKIREELDALADDVRKPLTEWETAEAARIAAEAEAERKRLADEEAARQAAAAAEAAARQAELDRLRAEIAERDRIEQERRDVENAERERIAAANRAEDERKAREAADAARIREAEERARAEAERVANAERERIEREAREAVAKAEAEAKAVREKAERDERERQEAIARVRREEEARQADREHRGKIMGEAKAALMTVGIEEDAARKIVLAIVAGEVPHVTLRF